VTVPPIPTLAPKATCAVPRIFSSSRIAAGQVAARAASAEVAVVGDAGAPAQVEAQVGPAGAAQVGVVGVGEQLRDRMAARAHRVEVGAHESREQVGGDARHRGSARAGFARALARARVRQRGHARRDEDVGRGERGRDRRWRLGPARRGLGGRIVSTASPPAPRAASMSASPSSALPGSAMTSTLSPAPTPRQRSTTVLTACSSAPIAVRLVSRRSPPPSRDPCRSA
jgi:hypothetical protein